MSLINAIGTGPVIAALVILIAWLWAQDVRGR